jgi:DNA repair exonuclease SbcCD ATPase subunit
MVERCVAAEKERHALDTARATSAADEARAAAQKERDEAQKQLKEQQLRHAIELAKAKAAAEAELDARSQQFAADLRALNASYREARDELGVLTQQLREVRRAKEAAERALREGLDHAQARQDDADARLFERSQLAVQLAGHASKVIATECH